MNLSIITSRKNFAFANDLISDLLDNIKMTSYFTDDDPSVQIHDLKRRLSSSNVILVVIDNDFQDNPTLMLTLKTALSFTKEHSEKIIIPVLINKCSIPDCLINWVHLTCDTSSRTEILRTKISIKKRLLRYSKKQNYDDRKIKNSSIITLTIAIEVFAIIFASLLFFDLPFNNIFENTTLSYVGIFSIFIALITLVLSYFSFITRKRKEDANEEIELYSKRLKNAIVPELINTESEQDKEIDALGRMMINLEDIKEFYTWSQKQAKAAFYLALWMCILGFVLMAASIALPIIFNIGIQSSILPAIGGVVTELIAGTALIVYKNSLSQLNHYHQALHEDERFLSSVNLISKFNSPQIQDEMLKEIIRSEIQMNLSNSNIIQHKNTNE